MGTSHKTKWREARMQIQAKKKEMILPDGRTCNHCAYIAHCKWVFMISGDETECAIYPSRFFDDTMTIYRADGTKSEVVHPFSALVNCKTHNRADIANENSMNVKVFCPSCERETNCIHTAELYECNECGEDFAKYIVPRK